MNEVGQAFAKNIKIENNLVILDALRHEVEHPVECLLDVDKTKPGRQQEQPVVVDQDLTRGMKFIKWMGNIAEYRTCTVGLA